MRFLWTVVLAAAAAAGDDLQQQLEAEKKARVADRQEFERRIAALEAGKDRMLETEVESYLAEHAVPQGAHGGGFWGLIDISAILDVTVGGSTAGDDALGEINLGHHDPKVTGFNVRNEELVVSADVDHLFHAVLDVVYLINEEGESEFELEEAFVATTGLPANLQLKVGQFLTEFGRSNPLHPHAWEFVNQPVVLGRVFGGDGWRGQGARLSWIAPTPFPLTLLFGAQNARGETQAAFLGEDGGMVGDYTLSNRSVSGLSDLAWNARIEASRDLASWHAALGLSFGYGPNGTGPDADTSICGVDLCLTWRPDADWRFVAWQTEFLWRHYDAAAQGVLPATVYEDWGFYTQVVWAFRRPWTAGIRYDFADSDGAYPGVAERLSLALTYYASEFGRIRLEANWDFVDGLGMAVPGASDRAFSLWINFSLTLGKHEEHG